MARSDAEALSFALALFAENSKHEWVLRGAARDIWFLLAHVDQPKCPNRVEIAKLFLSISQDIWNVATLFDRLDWMTQGAIENEDLKDRWWYYTALDIHSFHVEVRSALDYAAGVIRLFAPKPGQVTDTNSFRKLLEWLKQNGGRLQADVVQLALEQHEWFHEFRTVRDKLVHEGAYPIVFGSPRDGILFQVVQGGFRNVVNKPVLMYNENVAHFDRYAALYFARLLAFLEDLASLYIGTLRHDQGVGAESRAAGYGLVVRWMSALRQRISAAA